MSRAIGIASAQFIGARIAGQVTYIPAHVKNGKNINQRCIIPTYVNSNRGTNRDGTPGRSDQFRLVAWGKLADICAKSLPKGKALDCVCAPHSYEGRMYDAQGNMKVDNTGQPITVERIGFTIERLVFGEESQKEVDLEIQAGRRPVNWANPQHPDYQLWLQILRDRQAVQYVGGETFGFARVVIPSGPGIALMTGQPLTAQGTAAAGVTPAAVDPTQLAQAVAEVLRTGQVLNTQSPAVPNVTPFQTPVGASNIPLSPTGPSVTPFQTPVGQQNVGTQQIF
ncbi:hypothetical protein KAW18_04005 [candidate division WOR-3 bacterium]|nr:hypothetical protein [candidate division WOR-3 bacterium]